MKKLTPLETATVLANLRHKMKFTEPELLEILKTGQVPAQAEAVIADLFNELDSFPDLLERIIDSEGLDSELILQMKIRFLSSKPHIER